jgi:hypothetical protein
VLRKSKGRADVNCPAFFLSTKRIPADQNALKRRLFSGDVPAGVGRFLRKFIALSVSMFLHRRCVALKLQKHNFW